MPADKVGITIPDSEIQAFRKFSRADIDFLGKLVKKIAKKPPHINPEILIQSVAPVLDHSEDQVRPILYLVCRLAFVQRRMDVEVNSFIEALTSDLSQRSNKEWSREDKEGWLERIPILQEFLLPEGPIAIGAKASELLVEKPNILLKTRIITDVRPVFDDSGKKIQCVVPSHTMIIRFVDAGDLDEFHVAMDIEDLRLMRDHLERAIEKERVIRSELDRFKIRTLPESGE